ncbi:hypothetical protein GGI25_000232 [Coemansia spiralis]|uniref:Uncharacterized protein n=2 Tax=Coemansia TaxID=4863 RepID=A0A9W8GF43_9FUNG|nr:hypothetical protein BX070DRAFT_236165 [Coemansia spiralis]KAJ1995894.1 hypothetical protein EDC05_000554 [Coemansia umbellata]KAJ2625805.1 hypothetical protein GGI26_000266 [Coemansia sp. RSA 1358]KAJ2680928.1 hypothetical protein GGI25_000232 [Coemansia spiralis]
MSSFATSSAAAAAQDSSASNSRPTRPSPHSVFRSLSWAEVVVWDATALPDAFASLLSHCSNIAHDREHVAEHQFAALATLDIFDSVKSMYDADGPDVLRKAIQIAVADDGFANVFGSICDTYYFLRALDVFGLDNQSFDGIVALLKLDEHDDTAIPYTHSEIVALLNTYLHKLESKYPGIKQYATCVMLETNVEQEFGACRELLYAFRSELPADGDLYMNTLRCIADSMHENIDMEQLIERVRSLYDGSLSEYWPSALNFIWELYNDDGSEYMMEMEPPKNAADHTTGASNIVSVAN